ncbi:TPA: hypothetical protein U2I64_000403 [Providencia stuartii]|nr:hypothetical protein AFL46_10435 [Providencia stuartii]KSX95065.1 hypothetical protein APT95_03010 [Providencia stuartii]HEM6868175.1 hypothetical protein [Providencia stuartii]HEM7171764.1 hypothetical protein [Providencia stuartii]
MLCFVLYVSYHGLKQVGGNVNKILLSSFFVLGSLLSVPTNATVLAPEGTGAGGVYEMEEMKKLICDDQNDKQKCERFVYIAMTGAYTYGKVAASCEEWMRNGGIPNGFESRCEHVSKLDDYFDKDLE